MDARLTRAALAAAALALLGAGYKTTNFTVDAPTPELAREIGEAAEKFRRDLAIEWLGEAFPDWAQSCPITARVEPRLGAGGATSFVFNRGEVYNWRMTIQGSRERVLDSVLPHEITHTIFATHFRRPLPRWADEGACTTVEHGSERLKQQRMLIDFLRNGRGIAFSEMFLMTEYPDDIMPLYSQGYSLARYLIGKNGKREFLNFLSDGMEDDDWQGALKRHYEIENLGGLQTAWLDWVQQGSPTLTPRERSNQPATMLAQATTPVVKPGAAAPPPMAQRLSRPEPNLLHRESVASSSATRDEPAPPNAAEELVPVQLARAAPRRATADVAAAQPARESSADSSFTLPWRAPRKAAWPVRGDVVNQVTRPQTPETPRQVILEWSRGETGAMRR